MKNTVGIVPKRLFLLADLLVLVAAYLLAYSLMPAIESLFEEGGILHSSWLKDVFGLGQWTGQPEPLIASLWILVAIAPIALAVLELTGNYGVLRHMSRTRIVVNSVIAPVVGLSVVALILFALKSGVGSRVLAFTFVFLSAACLSSYRLLLRRYFFMRQRAGAYAKNVLLVGQTPAVTWMAHYFATNVAASDYRLVGYLHPPTGGGIGTVAAGPMELPRWGRVDELGDLLISRPIHEVIAVQPSGDGAWIDGVVQACDYMGVLLRIVPEPLLREPQTLHNLYPFAALNLPAVVLAPPHWDSDALFVKRVFDVLLTGALLVLLAPLMLAVALAIKLTTPQLPILYRWRVVGQNGVEFVGYKFTTMVPDADERKAELMARNEMTGPVFKLKDDPRVTPLGRYLRKFSLNELPQLWSVLTGDMSLVGPRPAFRHELERYEFWHKRKLSIKPGITCLWQTRGRNKISNFDDWVRMDLEYIDNWSLWLDCKILVRTAWVVVAGTGS